MAIIYPKIENIQKLKKRPEEGEIYLLNFLKNTLDDSFAIYFQSHLNGCFPDMVLMREYSGVMIIEVKDWDLTNYNLDDRGNWVLKNRLNCFGENVQKKSPIEQVRQYKNDLYQLHIESLLEQKIKNSGICSLISCAVYFHKASKIQIDNFLPPLKKSKYVDLLGHDSLTYDNFSQILQSRRLNRKTRLYFTNGLYKSFQRYLQPPKHMIEQGKEIRYTEEQLKLINKDDQKEFKVKGVIGSGKTMVLAKRAVNAYLRNQEPVLILTFNITLRNYIHDKLNEVRENFGWQNFSIWHYHQFIRSQANNYNIPITYDEYDDPCSKVFEKFENAKDEICKFKAIFIDEIQDFKPSWINLIKKYFLKEGGEFIVFGDEKQKIYDHSRLLKNKKPYTSIRGRWNLLNKSYRVTTELAYLATQFQKKFYIGKYEHEQVVSQRSLLDKSVIKYHYLSNYDINTIINTIIQIYEDTIIKLGVHDNDVCFLTLQRVYAREIDKKIRDKFHKKTTTTFESKEFFLSSLSRNSEEREAVRRNKKFNFWMNSGTTKISTIHSFKGWDINTLFLLIFFDNKYPTRDELIYTAIGRSKENLIIINIGNSRYHKFFKRNILNNDKV